MSDTVTINREAFGVLIDRGNRYRALLLGVAEAAEDNEMPAFGKKIRETVQKVDAEYSALGIKEQT